MSFVTRCTSCGTLFRVVADQLKISEGWVRCGQCATVFDAQANLVNEAAPAVPSPAPQEPLPITVAAPSFAEPSIEALPSASDNLAADIESFRASKLQDSAWLPISEPPASSRSAGFEDAAKSQPNNQSDGAPASEPISILPGSEEPTTFIPSSKLDSTSFQEFKPSDVAPLRAEAITPGFVKQAQRAQRWRSPAMRLALGFMALALLCVLAVQIALHQKDRIAAQWPQSKAWLATLCQQAGCQLQAYKRIESITVDASSFNRINKNNPQLEAITQSYRLAVTLKNNGTLAVALPHVELSLQDAQDATVMRRVLSPADLGSSLTALAPAQDMAGSLTLQIDTAQFAGSKIQGYRVLAFYP